MTITVPKGVGPPEDPRTATRVLLIICQVLAALGTVTLATVALITFVTGG